MRLETSLKSWMLVSALLLAICYTSVMGKVIYVDADANGLNDGTSWGNAYNYLQDGLADAASSPKPLEIRVAQGTYKPDRGASQTSGNRYATFRLINGVTIKGGYAGFGEPDPNAQDIELYETILSGDLAGNDVDANEPFELWNEPSRAENSFHVVTGSGTNETSVLDGINIRAGNAYDPPWNPYIFEPNDWGGGVYNEYGGPIIFNCTLRENSARMGGGGMYNEDSSPVVTNCIFSQNDAMAGGGVFNWQNSKPVLNNCVFSRNLSEISKGGGMYNYESSPILANCTFTSNSGGMRGGGMYNWLSDVILNNCTFSGNSATIGGGMANDKSTVTISSCLFIRNTSWHSGGGIENENANLTTLINCTFFENSASLKGGGLYSGHGSNTTLTNSILCGDTAVKGPEIALEQGGDFYGPPTITILYSDIKGGKANIYADPNCTVIWGSGNIDVDPCFADANNGDYHLKSQAGRWDPNSESWVKDNVTSLCIDAGDPASPIGYEPFPNGGIINLGAYGGTAEASKSYFGEPVCETIVAGDINGDCIVNFKDFAILSRNWLRSWKPGSKIAFVSNRDGNFEIYVMNSDGTNQTRLTFNESSDFYPSWSPEGTRMAFMSNRDGSEDWIHDIYAMDVDGTNVTRLTYHESDDREPAWGTDGAKIAFVSYRDGNAEIYVMNADGSEQTRLTFNESMDKWPAWSPDGSKIVFSSKRSGNFEIYVMNADGSNQTMITNNPSSWNMEPSWSPDGTKITFCHQQALYIMNPDGSNQVLIYDNYVRKPTWSPDGKKIAFRMGGDGAPPEGHIIQNIYSVDADGSNLIQLTTEQNNPQWDKINREPSWSPYLTVKP